MTAEVAERSRTPDSNAAAAVVAKPVTGPLLGF
jgi:hypothetical protein